MEGCFCGGMYVAGIELARAMDMIYIRVLQSVMNVEVFFVV